MATDRQRFQFASRDLLESVTWAALGIGAIRAAHVLRDLVFPKAHRPIDELLIVFLFWAIPGVAFGAAIGSLINRRSDMIRWGLIVWPVLAILVIGFA